MVFRTVPEPSLLWAHYVRSECCWRFDRFFHGNSFKFFSIIVLSFGKLGTFYYSFFFAGAAGDVPCFYRAGNMSTEAEVRHKRRRKHAVITLRFVPLSGQEPGPVEFGSHERSRELLEQAFDDGNDELK